MWEIKRSSWGLLALAGLVACGPSGPGPAGTASVAAAGKANAPSPPAVRPETRTFSDWYASCDNGNDCFAFTGTDAGGWLMVRQPAGPDAAAQILAGLSAFSGDEAYRIVPLGIDGEQQTLIAEPGDVPAHSVPAESVRATLARLAAARSVTLGAGEAETSLPAAGASAALLWIDEKQGRLGTITALIRRGDRPASSVPAAPGLPRVQAVAAIDQGRFAEAGDPGEQGAEADLTLPATLEALTEVKQCRADTDFNPYLQKAVLAARLSPATELWGVPCDAGAYNAMYDFYLTGPGGTSPRKAEFPGWEPREITEGDIAGDGLVNPVFDAASNTLSHFPRARGIGDCGTIQSWAWTGEAFVLTGERSMGDCWGMPSTLWPTTWRTQ